MNPPGVRAGTDGAPPSAATVDVLFAAQVAHAPDATAIVCGERTLTFAALDFAAEALAAALRRHGCARGTRVAMALGRSVEAVITMLAVIKAGGAFVPLDLAYPREQLADIMADCAPACLVVGGEAPADLAATIAPTTPVLVAEAHTTADHTPAPPPGTAGDDAAYVMYTSGSTGRPKGVLVPHGAIVRLVVGADYAQLGSTEVILQLAPLAFDASTFEIWGSLLNGGVLVIPEAPRPTLDDIADAIVRHGVTTLWLTAGLFNVMVDHRLDALRPLRQLLAGGDVLSKSHVAKVLRALPNCRLINGYGPTENTTFTCCHAITSADLDGDAGIPIGRPINGTTVHILDDELRPVAPGEEGQLCAGGAGVALGYLNRSELTAQKFIADPFTAGQDGRLYLTGDRARQRADGAILFLGRVDRQAKINGRRIELDAVEAALRRQPGVVDAAAVLREDVPGRKMVVGYVTGTTNGVLAALRTELPEWMVPAAIVPLTTLPLTPNGKLDRAKLPPPTFGQRLAPRNDAERAVAEVWQRVLGLAVVGRDDNFFDLGGTSLQLLEVHATLQCTLHPELTIIDLFQNPRVSDIAALILRERPAAPPPAAVADRFRRSDEVRRRMRAARTP
jgi:amino acid adenylation domain-containing protein